MSKGLLPSFLPKSTVLQSLSFSLSLSTMANEEPADTAPEAAVPPPAGTKQHHYPEMIMAAIESLDDKNGSNKTAISKYVEANYGDLSAAHSTLLTHYLKKMKLSGEIFMVKNNYMKPDPTAQPKRGRGRPPKPRETPARETAASPPRPRGRPPKPKEPLVQQPSSERPAPTTVTGKKRGRPRKNFKPETAPPPPMAADGTVVKRGRGRPPKAKRAVAAVGA